MRSYYYWIILFYVLCHFNCTKEQVALLPAGINAEIERAEQVEIFYSDSAKLKVKIVGPVMLMHTDNGKQQEEFPNGVEVDFFDESGNISSKLTAKYGSRLRRQGKVIVRDSVVWRSIENETIETEELIWNERTKKIFTKKFARISRSDEIIYGYGFEADQDFSNAQIRAVTGRVKVENIEND